MFYQAILMRHISLKVYPALIRLFCSNLNSLKSWNVIFYGTDMLSEVTLNALNSNRLSETTSKMVRSLDVVCIKTDCKVRQYAKLNNLTIHTWPYDVPVGVYDVGVVVSFGHLIPSESILACKYGIINAHPSLLPHWRGAAPIIHTILNGDTETGVTITQVSPRKFDVGNIVMQEKFNVPEECSSKLLIDELSKLAAKLVLKTLENLSHYLELSYPQPSEGVTYACKIKPEHGYINWEHSALSIYRKFKAFDGYFDVCTFWKSMKVIIIAVTSMRDVAKANVSNLVSHSVSPGFCYFHKKRKVLFVKCQDEWFGITKVQIPKKGKITALDFYNGFMSKEIPEKCYFLLNKDVT